MFRTQFGWRMAASDDHDVAVLKGAGATVFLALSAAAAAALGFRKASPDDPVHPGWPAGTPGGLGGKFRPKDGTAAGEAAVKRQALRRKVRALLLQALSLPFEAAANLVPVLGEAADVVMVAQLASTSMEFHQLDLDTKAAVDFLAEGPHSLDKLQLGSDSESFSSFDQFKKTLVLLLYQKRFGSAGSGYDYHHIVEQGGANASNFSSEQLQNTDNIVRIPKLLHEAINSEYSVKSEEAMGQTLRQRLREQSFSEQHQNGIVIMQKLGIIQ